MPSSSGKKPGQSGRRGRRQRLSSPRHTTGFRPRITVTEERSSGVRDTNEFRPRQTASELQSAVPIGASGFQPTVMVTDSHWQSAVPTDACGFQPKVTALEAQSSSERQCTCTWIMDTKAYMRYATQVMRYPRTFWCCLLPKRAENVQNQSGRPHLFGPATQCLLSFKENIHVKEKQTLCNRRSIC